ncbi:hypothetical protein RWE15_25380 [Virgibacillus halophilus]|uniref:Uncharacterized protein n=1 Tax=Tigheibacillus halophilus TaxID=361280 RepID=A0ABU5CCF5_9BACI|nr:hypothetical protein [Virgibacillus halophilus]
MDTTQLETAASMEEVHVEKKPAEKKERTGMDYQEVHSLLRKQNQEKKHDKVAEQPEKLEPIIPLDNNMKNRHSPKKGGAEKETQ